MKKHKHRHHKRESHSRDRTHHSKKRKRKHSSSSEENESKHGHKKIDHGDVKYKEPKTRDISSEDFSDSHDHNKTKITEKTRVSDCEKWDRWSSLKDHKNSQQEVINLSQHSNASSFSRSSTADLSQIEKDRYLGSNHKTESDVPYHSRKHEKRKSCDQYSSPLPRVGVDNFSNKPERSNHTKVDRGSEMQSSERHDRINYDHTEEDTSNFSFMKYKHELNRSLSSFNLIKDTKEFWSFVEKYEMMEGKSGKFKDLKKYTEVGVNSIGIPENYDKSHRLNLSLKYRSNELFVRVQEIPELTKERLHRFKEIITIYIDFKQREKFQKLKKLRDEQSNLPVAQYREEIVNSVRNERVVIIAGDTGCGKSTQVPQYLYAAGLGKIACTQPRRIACISLAKRVAYETLTENRNEVGYQIRFEKQKNQETKITFITEGLLLRQVSGEEELSQYDVIVLDEVHERHLHGDFLLGIMKCLIHQRSDLKLVLMSATINIELFSNYFANEDVKIIQVPGRLYSIQLNYRPVLIEDKSSKNERFNPSPYIQIMQMIDRNYPKDQRGDLLIFLSGMSEITSVVDAAKEYCKKDNNWIVLPLHSTLSIADQDKVFGYAPEGVRKCIVSTNIAETSITIDGIRFVADSGKVKEMSYDPTCKMQKLKEFWISKASAEQRKGRAGRTGPGVCYRLYSADDYSAFEKYSTPEMQRVPLDSSLLQMIAMGLPDPRKFPFIEPPPANSVENSIVALKEHGALTEDERLTSIGKTLARLPVDIAIGKMLIMGSLFHQIEPVLSLAAALSVQTPFTNKAYRDLDCEESRKDIESDHGDPISLLNAYKEWLEIKSASTGEIRSGSSNSKKWCKRRGLEEQRFYEMTKLRTQFKDLLEDCKLLRSTEDSSEMSSSDRIIRHGELKLLRSLKRSYKQSDSNRRKKLKLEDDTYTIEDDQEDGEVDIKDIEFRMRNDVTKVHDLVTASTACSYKDLTMLKLILCSGLYPQFAMADEFNYCKTVSEQLFHTKVKPFVALHPMSFFGVHPQVLQLEEPDIVSIPGYRSKTPVSAKHQMLTYLSLLETTKPYLVNTLRMPAAQTLLLFSQEIDTNSTFTTIACDSWVSIEFPTPDSGAIILLQAAKLRKKWDLLLNLRLQDSISSENKEENIEEIECELNRGLVDFMHTSIPYTMKRLLAADLKNMYKRNEEDPIILDPNPFSDDFPCEPHERKGGVRVTKQITYNCLLENEWSDKIACEMLEVEWQCSTCDFRGTFSSIEKLQHMNACKKENLEQTSSKPASLGSKKKNAIPYECGECQKTLFLTPTEVLKHVRQHAV